MSFVGFQRSALFGTRSTFSAVEITMRRFAVIAGFSFNCGFITLIHTG